MQLSETCHILEQFYAAVCYYFIIISFITAKGNTSHTNVKNKHTVQ